MIQQQPEFQVGDLLNVPTFSKISSYPDSLSALVEHRIGFHYTLRRTRIRILPSWETRMNGYSTALLIVLDWHATPVAMWRTSKLIVWKWAFATVEGVIVKLDDFMLSLSHLWCCFLLNQQVALDWKSFFSCLELRQLKQRRFSWTIRLLSSIDETLVHWVTGWSPPQKTQGFLNGGFPLLSPLYMVTDCIGFCCQGGWLPGNEENWPVSITLNSAFNASLNCSWVNSSWLCWRATLLRMLLGSLSNKLHRLPKDHRRSLEIFRENPNLSRTVPLDHRSCGDFSIWFLNVVKCAHVGGNYLGFSSIAFL